MNKKTKKTEQIIKILEKAIDLIEKCGGPGSGRPGPCPMNKPEAKPSTPEGASKPAEGSVGDAADKFKDWSPKASLDAVRATLKSALKGKRLKETPDKMSSWGVSFSTKSLSATEIEIAFRKDGWSTNIPPSQGSSTTSYYMVKGSNLALISSLSYSGPSHIIGTDPKTMTLVMNRSPHG